jgi:catechol 2,3-dioxygenase-like lactoylglutathione lyase family enzyme
MNMKLERLIPILNVSDLQESFAWFEKIGWKKGWEWGEPPDFGGVSNGDSEIFLCQNGQGSRGGAMPRHVEDDDTGGVWMSWFLESPEAVDAAHQHALENGITVTRPPRDYPWGVREFNIRHPDGHTFRVGAGLEEECT